MQRSSIRIGLRAFVLAFVILFLLMIAVGIATRVVPAGTFERRVEGTRQLVIPGSFTYAPVALVPVWRWFTAPVEVLFAPGNIVVITIILFIVFVGGAFTILEHAGVLKAVLDAVVRRFAARRYLLMALLQFFFMLVAAGLGIYESMVPLIVFIVPLAIAFGWDSLTGLGMSLLPLAFGFSAAFFNPFTIGVAQRIAGLPLFSGAPLRLLFFGVTYVVVHLFVARHARKVEANPASSPVRHADALQRAEVAARAGAAGGHAAERTARPVAGAGMRPADSTRMRRAMVWFGAAMALAFLFILVTARIPAMSDLAFPVMAFLFLVGGAGAGLISGMNAAKTAQSFIDGTVQIAPGILLILMSLSIRHIVDLGGITDTILFHASNAIAGASQFGAAFMVYLVTLFMNFFIGSASAKAFLMMPILAPLADLVGITRQTAVLAFGLGDGFSNMLFPTNALLLIGLGFTPVGYPTWLRWTIGLQLLVFVLSMGLLAVAVAIGYGPL